MRRLIFRSVALGIALALSVPVLSGCGSQSITGTWREETVASNPVADTRRGWFALEEGGTYEMYLGQSDERVKGTYETDTKDGASVITFTPSDRALPPMTLYYELKDPGRMVVGFSPGTGSDYIKD